MPELAEFWGKALGNRIWQQSWGAGGEGSGWGETLVSPAASRQLSSMRVGGKSEVFVSGGRIATAPRRRQLETAACWAGAGVVARADGERGSRLGARPSSSSPGLRAGLFLGLKPELSLAPC